MKTTLKKPLLFSAAILPIALVGGYFTDIYTYNAYTSEMQNEILSQLGSYELYLAAGTLQSGIYAFIAAFAGYILAEKTGLMKSLCFEKAKLIRTAAVTVITGVLFSLDAWIFGRIIPEVAAVYESKITVIDFLASILYGGVVEELLMRLFLMSLLVLLLWKLFFKKQPKENIPKGVFITANIIAALLFAAGHLPATISIFGSLAPLTVFRCFLLNGAFGAVFGEMYRRYGIQYAILTHAGVHVVSKLIWIILI